MTRKQDLIDTLRRSFDGDAWHGPALKEALADVTAEEALWRPARHVHSIWEITLHLAGWTQECASRLATGQAAEPEGGDWPEVGAQCDRDGWEDALQQLFHGRDVLLRAVQSLGDDALDSTEGTSSAPHSTPITRAGLIAGIAQHNAYHGGQISLLKKQARCVV
ncbi:MAG TPA: DinB family protein [Longimicrobiales bacterium]